MKVWFPLALLVCTATCAQAQLDRLRSEGLFMCPCPGCKGKWLPNCGDRNCRPAQELRIKLRRLEDAGESDDAIARAIEGEFGRTILADPSVRRGAAGAAGIATALALAVLAAVAIAVGLVRAIRPARATPVPPAEVTPPPAAASAAVAQALADLARD